MHTVGHGGVGPQTSEREAEIRQGFFWDAPPKEERSAPEVRIDPSKLVTIDATFLRKLADEAERVHPLKLSGPIEPDEWWTARRSPPPIVDRWYYEDVGCFIAPGGTGKTTLLLYQAIHIVLGRDLFGHEVVAPGPVIILTAEDTRESLIARLRLMSIQMGLSGSEIWTIQQDILITDVSGLGIKLTKVEREAVVPSAYLDRLIVEVAIRYPSLLIIDPLVSFGVGESRVNDAEQGMIDAARRIRNQVGCAVIYVHHTGKANARDETTDQYSGRGGSALADGSRMVHVLVRMDGDKWTEATGDELRDDEAGFRLTRPKVTWCPPQPDIFLKRRGYTFARYDHVDGTAGAQRVGELADEKIIAFLKEQLGKGVKHTQNTVEEAKVLSQKATRQALHRLVKDGRLSRDPMGTGGRGGAHFYLRPVDLPITT